MAKCVIEIIQTSKHCFYVFIYTAELNWKNLVSHGNFSSINDCITFLAKELRKVIE